jgi:hypothetical protein
VDAEFLCFLDPTDQIAPTAMRLIWEMIALNPDIELVFNDEDRLDAAGRSSSRAGTRNFSGPGICSAGWQSFAAIRCGGSISRRMRRVATGFGSLGSTPRANAGPTAFTTSRLNFTIEACGG